MKLQNNDTQFHVSEHVTLNGFSFPPFFFQDEEARFHYNVQVVDAGETPEPSLAELKAEKVALLNFNTNILLAKTDWFYVRQMEVGKVVPEAVQVERQRIREWNTSVEEKILRTRSPKTLDAISVVWGENGTDDQAG